MSNWNEQSAPNNNLASSTIQNSKLVKNNKAFSEELSDGGERNKTIESMRKKDSFN